MADTHIKPIKDDRMDRRHLDSLAATEFVIDSIKKMKLDFLIHAGDMWDKRIPLNETPFNSIINKYKELSEITPIIIIKGNHDEYGSLDIFNKINERKIIAIEEQFEIVVLSFEGEFYTLEEAEKLNIIPKVIFYAITYPELKKLALSEELDALDLHSKVDTRIGELLTEGNKKTESYNCFKIVIFHGSVNNYKKSESQITPSQKDFHVDAKTLNIGEPDYVALGHIHLPQTFTPGYPRTVYAGSTYGLNAGETEDKFFCRVTIDDESYSHEKIKIPIRKQITNTLQTNDVRLPLKEMKRLYDLALADHENDHRIIIRCNSEDRHKYSKFVAKDNLKIKIEINNKTMDPDIIKDIDNIKTIEDEISLFFKYKKLEDDEEVKEIILNSFEKSNLMFNNDVTLP